MFENTAIRGVHATRYIMSWIRSGGELRSLGRGYGDFEDWLKSIELNEEERKIILEIAKNGKLEFETSAKKFLNKKL